MDTWKGSTRIGSEIGSDRLESIIGGSILFFLGIIGILIFSQQFRYDEDKFNASVIQPGSAVDTTASSPEAKVSLKILGLEPEDYISMSDRESFDQYTLSDKINGKADGYLASGFVQLVCRRFVHSSNQENWFEFFLYNMGFPRNSFSVYSKQKRQGVREQDFTEFAYSTENAVFFVHGTYYIEIIAAVEDEAVIQDMILMAKNFMDKFPGGNVELPELEYLPADNLDLESISLILNNGFGFKGFDNIFTGAYGLEGHRTLAFVSLRETAEEAESLAIAYDNFLSEFIGQERLEPETDQIPGVKIADIFGEYEIFFVKGNVLAGIHAASDKTIGTEIAFQLYTRISELLK
jgi:hypothetical protein